MPWRRVGSEQGCRNGFLNLGFSRFFTKKKLKYLINPNFSFFKEKI